MKRIIYLSMTILLCSCINPYEDEYKVFNECLDDSEIQLLEGLVSNFERVIDESYKGDDISLKYKSYLNDFISQKLDASIFHDNESKKLISELKKSSLFHKMWVLYSKRHIPEAMKDDTEEIVAISLDGSGNEPDQQAEKDFYIIDFYDDYFNCIIDNCKNKSVKDAYKVVQEVGDISPSLLAGGLSIGFKDEDYNDIITKVSIAISFYYFIVLMIE